MIHNRFITYLLNSICLCLILALTSCSNRSEDKPEEAICEANAVQRINEWAIDIADEVTSEIPDDTNTRGLFSWIGKVWTVVKADAKTIHVKFGFFYIRLEVNPYDFADASIDAYRKSSTTTILPYNQLNAMQKQTIDSLIVKQGVNSSNYTAAQAHNTLVLQALIHNIKHSGSYETDVTQLMEIGSRFGINTSDIDISQTAATVRTYMTRFHPLEMRGTSCATLMKTDLIGQSTVIDLIEGYFNAATRCTSPTQVHALTNRWIQMIQPETQILASNKEKAIEIVKIADASFDMWYHIFRITNDE